MTKTHLAIIFFSATLYGCGKHYVVDAPALQVTNMTGFSILIKTRLCDENSNYTKNGLIITAGNTLTIPVSSPCIDALATNQEGVIMGTQTKLRIPPNVKWSIY